MNKKKLLLDKKFPNISNFLEFKEDFKNFETLEKKYNKLYNNMLFIMIHKQIEQNNNKIEAVCKGNGTLREIKLYKLVSNLRIVPSSSGTNTNNYVGYLINNNKLVYIKNQIMPSTFWKTLNKFYTEKNN